MHDAQELTEHLQLSCAMIRRHRSRMIPGGIGYSDNPTFGGFGPKSPCNESAMEMGDMEAAFVGNLARYCIARGSIPAIPLKGFWWVNGVCRGVGGSGMDEDEIGFFSRSEEHTSELQSPSSSSYAVFCLKKKKRAACRR